jgi:hypothetical protein
MAAQFNTLPSFDKAVVSGGGFAMLLGFQQTLVVS